MAAMSLSHVIEGLTHDNSHTPYLVHSSGNMELGETSVTPLTRSDHSVVVLEFSVLAPQQEGGLIRSVHLQQMMNLLGSRGKLWLFLKVCS